MSDKTVEFWINEDDSLCFFDKTNVLKIHNWTLLAFYLMHEMASNVIDGCESRILDEPQEALGCFGEHEEEPTDEGTSP